MRWFWPALFAACWCPALCQGQTLEERLKPLIKAHEGDVAVVVKHLGTGEAFEHRADAVMPTASLIKLPVLIETYLRADKGDVDLDAMLTLTKENMVPGSGILTSHFSAGAKFCLKDAARLMIVFSDNTATNMVIDAVGIKAVNERMRSLGCPNTVLNAKVFLGSKTSVDPARTKEYGLGSTTAGEMVSLLEKLHDGELGGKATCNAMVGVLKKCDHKDSLPRFLPRSVGVAFKTGAVSNARTAAGVLYFEGGPVAVCVLTDKNKDRRWASDNAGLLLGAKVAEQAYLHFKK